MNFLFKYTSAAVRLCTQNILFHPCSDTASTDTSFHGLLKSLALKFFKVRNLFPTCYSGMSSPLHALSLHDPS